MKLSEIAVLLDGVLEGNDADVIGIAGTEEADAGYITFMEQEKHRKNAESSRAKAVIIPEKAAGIDGKSVIRVKNPRLGFAKLLTFFHPAKIKFNTIHPTAIIGENVRLGENVGIGAYAVIENNCTIGNNVQIYPHTYIAEGCTIGDDTIIKSSVSLMDDTVIGNRTIIHSGAVIGTDGFGFVRDGATQYKIPQIGHVEIGDDVEIGANATIDRATTGKTIIGSGTKIDNLVQIGHNTVLGKDCTIVSQSGVAGSTKIGDRVILAAQSGVRDHTEIGSDSIIAGRSGVTKPVKKGTIVSGFPARDHREELKIEAIIAKLPELANTIDQLCKKLEKAGM